MVSVRSLCKDPLLRPSFVLLGLNTSDETHSTFMATSWMASKEIAGHITQSQATDLSRLSQEDSDFALASRMQLEEVLVVSAERAKGSTHNEVRSQISGFESNYNDHDVRPRVPSFEYNSLSFSSTDEAAERYKLKGKACKFDDYYIDAGIPCETCSICMYTEITLYNSHVVSDRCNHRFCTDCLQKHGETMVKSGKFYISCPQYKCTESWSPQLCQHLVPSDLLDQMSQRQVENLVQDWERVYCPYPDCSALQLRPDIPVPNEPSGSQKTAIGGVECLSCHRLFCLECQVPWHPNLTCEEYETLPDDEKSDLVLLRGLAKEKKWKRCSCGYVVERNEGCNHMRCRCGKEFCYVCGGNWKHDHLCKRKKLA